MIRPVTYEPQTWDEWLAGLDPETRAQASSLRDRFVRAGATDAEDWVRSEIDEEFAQLARFLFLRLVWDDQLQPWRSPAGLETFVAAQKLLSAGVDAETLQNLCATVASDAVWRMLTLIDDAWDHPYRDDPEMPGWRLIEINRVTGEPTGRAIEALHESLREVDPEGREGEPIL